MKTKILPIALVLLTLTSCNDFLDITPTGKVIAQTGDEFRSLLTYEYHNFAKDRYMTTIRTDEILMENPSNTDKDAYLDLWRWKDDNPAPTTSYFSWRTYYHTLYIANYVIEHQSEITNATTTEVSQLIGEAYMLRAYTHFLLVNLYAESYTHCTPAITRGVPMQLKADVTAVLGCSSIEVVYQQVLKDINEAEKLLQVEKWEEGENYRFNKISAQALRTRVLLYMGDWKNALNSAYSVLETRNELEDLNKSKILPNSYKSVENIVALERFSSNLYTIIETPSAEFINMYRTGDQRRTKFYKRITSSSNSLLKGKSDEFACSFRIAEVYLTAAESAARLGYIDEAKNLLTPLMEKRLNKSALQTTSELIGEMNQEELIEEILNERARELAFEGHRWYDLRRTTRPELKRDYEETIYTLTTKQYTMRFPAEAVAANPELERWELGKNK